MFMRRHPSRYRVELWKGWTDMTAKIPSEILLKLAAEIK